MLTLGILLGLGAAAIQSISFAGSRNFIVQGYGNAVRLIVMGHAMMGVFAAVLLPVWWHPLLLDWEWLPDAIGASVFYLVGQGGFMFALRHSESSRVTPLLALKLPFVAMVSIPVLGIAMNLWQWVAVGLAMTAAFVLNRIGGGLPLKTLLGLLFAVCNYAFSDVFIVRLVDACGVNGVGSEFSAAARAVCVAYIVCGLAAGAALPWVGVGERRGKAWIAASPYACAWLPSMYLFFASLGMIGPVLGNIVVSTRGLWAIALGVLIARLGHHHLEQRVERSVLVRRLIAALLLTIAIGLYGWAGNIDAEEAPLTPETTTSERAER